MKHNMQVIAAYVLIVALFAFGIWDVQRIQSENHHQFCSVSDLRWQVQHDVIVIDHEPIPLPPVTTPGGADNSFNVERTKIRNAQLQDQSDRLLAELGAKPAPC